MYYTRVEALAVRGTVFCPGVLALSFDESAGFAAPPAFGPYRVLHQIGSGVLGPVFRTCQADQDRLVAVKAFRLDVVPEVAARLADALRALARTGVIHPTIVPAVSAGLEGSSPYLAMEYIAAETLDVSLRQLAPAPLDRALLLLADIGAAIEAGWQAGVGHGALHPRDVFVGSESDVCVTGFGVAAALESVGVKLPPRRPYVAPERAAGQRWDIRADVYSLGVIAHELLTRRRPAGHGEQDGSLAAGTSAERRVLVRKVLAAAMAERPEHRFASPADFIKALQAVADGAPLEGLPDETVSIAAAPDEADAPARPPAPESPVSGLPLLNVAERPETRVDRSPAVSTPFDIETKPAASGASQPPALAPPVLLPPVLTAAAPPAAPDSGAPAAVSTAAPAVPAVKTPMRPIRVAPTPAPLAPPVSTVVQTRAPFPWAAVAAAAIGGIALGTAGGYRIGTAQVRAIALPPVVSTAAQALVPGTDVVVAPEPATPTSSVTTPPPADATDATASEAAKPARAPEAQDRDKPATATRARVDTGPGSVTIETRPAGARVFLDGRMVGMTPMTVPGLRAGSHPVRLELTGHKTLTTAVSIAAGDHAQLKVTLETTQVFDMSGPGRQVKKKE